MLSLHQLRCFLTALEHGSLTAAAEHLGYAQPSVSEQVRSLERTLGAALFTRAGRGVVPTPAGEALRPYAEQALASADEGRRAVQGVAELESGTVRFGAFGTMRLYAGAALVADVLERHPGVRVELIGQNSAEVQEQLRSGHLEAAMIAVPQVTADGLTVVPVARDELVYISAHRERLAKPVTAKALGDATLVMAEASYRVEDSTRLMLRRWLHESGVTPTTKVEVEDVETAVELVGRGLADSIVHRGVAEQLLPRLAPEAGWVSLRPRQWDVLAIAHRTEGPLSPAARLMIELATRRIQAIAEPI